MNHWQRIPGSLAVYAVLASVACASGSEVDEDALADAFSATGASGSPVRVSDPPLPTWPKGSRDVPCPKAPCAERPVIFVHGISGDNSDADALFATMTAEGERWDERIDVGTSDHGAWAPRSIPRRSWLFAFDYYVRSGADRRPSHTAGPGRIGSNRDFECTAPVGRGRLVPDSGSYDAGVTHDYSSDLASMVDDVLRATGAPKVDIVAHSMGGLVARSYMAFASGNTKVETLMLIASPHLGVPFAPVSSLFVGESWMFAHELTELDQGSPVARSKFTRCGAGARKDSWPRMLLEAERDAPILAKVHCMSGTKDLLVGYDSAHHPQCSDHLVLPNVDHSGLLRDPRATERVRRLVGGVATSSPLPE